MSFTAFSELGVLWADLALALAWSWMQPACQLLPTAPSSLPLPQSPRLEGFTCLEAAGESTRCLPSSLSVQVRVVQGRRAGPQGQQHNNSLQPLPPAGLIVLLRVVLSLIKRKEEHCAIRPRKKAAPLTAPAALGHPRYKCEEIKGQHAG